MKICIKLLALLTASLLTLSTLSCSKGEDADKPAQTTDDGASSILEQYKGLSPAEIYSALLKADQFVFINVMDRKVTGAKITITHMLEKDGNTVRYTISQDAEDTTYNVQQMIYCDLEKQLYLTQSGDEWFSITDPAKVNLTALLEGCAPVDLLFDEKNYQKSGDEYHLLQDAILQIIGSTTATATGKMTEKDNTYTVHLLTEDSGNTVEMVTKVLFGNVQLTMPDYTLSGAESGTARPDAQN